MAKENVKGNIDVENKQSFKEWMKEKRVLDRWTVVTIGIVGAFAGALFTVIWMMFGISK
jgi:hypothetical protein